jgi:hypothetical protein
MCSFTVEAKLLQTMGKQQGAKEVTSPTGVLRTVGCLI